MNYLNPSSTQHDVVQPEKDFTELVQVSFDALISSKDVNSDFPNFCNVIRDSVIHHLKDTDLSFPMWFSMQLKQLTVT